MGKHKKAHRTYPDSGKKHEKNRPQAMPRQAIRAIQPDRMTTDAGKMTAEPSSTRRLVTAESVRAGHPDVFDLRPGALIKRLHLRKTRYAPLAAYGHFGRSDGLYDWEAADRAAELLNAVCGDDTRMYRPKRRRRVNRLA